MIDTFMMRVEDVRDHFVGALANESFVIDKTGVKTIELIGSTFLADESAIFGEPNEDYVRRELEWYNSQSLSVDDFPDGAPAIWKQVASSEHLINSNYGWCIYSKENGSQFDNVVSELNKNRNSRRAVMIYTRPSMHSDYCTNGMSDFICTNAVQYMIRDDELYTVVQMRSNDVVFGYRNDFAWQDHVAQQVQEQTNCKSRTIIWNVGSLHVYERHFHLVR